MVASRCRDQSVDANTRTHWRDQILLNSWKSIEFLWQQHSEHRNVCWINPDKGKHENENERPGSQQLVTQLGLLCAASKCTTTRRNIPAADSMQRWAFTRSLARCSAQHAAESCILPFMWVRADTNLSLNTALQTERAQTQTHAHAASEHNDDAGSTAGQGSAGSHKHWAEPWASTWPRNMAQIAIRLRMSAESQAWSINGTEGGREGRGRGGRGPPLSRTMFGWVSWVKEHQHEYQQQLDHQAIVLQSWSMSSCRSVSRQADFRLAGLTLNGQS